MPIATNCPNCKAIFRLPEEMAGKKAKCQKCAQLFVVPMGDGDGLVPGAAVAESAEPKASGSTDFAAKDDAPPPVVKKVEERQDDEDDDHDDAPLPPRSKRKSTESRSRERPVKSGFGMLPIILAVLGLGLFLCVGCAGVGGAVWFFRSQGQVAQRPVIVPVGMQGAIPVAFAPNGEFRQNNFINFQDRVNADKWRHKLYTVHMEKGRTYQIDLISQEFDAFLCLTDTNGMIIRRDDDSGGALNSRIVHIATQTGVHQVHATSLGGQRNGAFTLIIQRR